MTDVSDPEAEDDEVGRAGAILKRPKQAEQGWSKTGPSSKIKKKKKPRLLIQQR